MKKVFICSPYRGDVEKNVKTAKRMCRLATEKGYAAFAPHIFYTQFLDDDNAEHRKSGIDAGLEFLAVCNELWVLDCEPTEGMKKELTLAGVLNMPVKKIRMKEGEK